MIIIQSMKRARSTKTQPTTSLSHCNIVNNRWFPLLLASSLFFCLLCFRTSCSILLGFGCCIKQKKKRFIIPKDGNMEAKNISSSPPPCPVGKFMALSALHSRIQHDSSSLCSEKWLSQLHYRPRSHTIFHILHSFFFVIPTDSLLFISRKMKIYVCSQGSFIRCNEASQQQHNSL